MPGFFQTIHPLTWVLVLGAGAVLFLGIFPLIRITLGRWLKRRNLHGYDLIRGTLGVFYVFWAINTLWLDTVWLPWIQMGAFLLLSGCLFWFAGRDFLAGMILRAGGRLKKTIKIPEIPCDGPIERLSWLGLYVHQENGGLIYIPYGRIIFQILHVGTPEGSLVSRSFFLSIPRDLSQETFKKMIFREGLTCPGSVGDFPPLWKVQHETTDKTSLDSVSGKLTITALAEEYLDTMESRIRRKLSLLISHNQSQEEK